MKAVPERQFFKQIREAGCTTQMMGNGEPGIFYKGRLVCTFAIWHGKGSKREVGTIYTRRFEKLIAEIKEQEQQDNDQP